MSIIPITLAVEDDLSEITLRRIFNASRKSYAAKCIYRRQGFGYLKKNITAFNNAAKGCPWLVLTDLDQAECPPLLAADWFGHLPKQQNLIFQVAVREVEAWLLADSKAFAHFARIRVGLIPQEVESIPEPKAFLIDLIRRSKRRVIREAIVPPPGRTQGPGYNACLAEYVNQYWNPANAKLRSPSLDRLVRLLDGFRPAWPTSY